MREESLAEPWRWASLPPSGTSTQFAQETAAATIVPRGAMRDAASGLNSWYPSRETAPTDFVEKLQQLQQAHQDVRQGLDALEAAIASDAPDSARYVPARFALTKASRTRRTLFAEICEMLTDLPRDQRDRLDALLREDASQARLSSAHIRTWTPEAIEEDWPGYRNASAAMRKVMRARITRERVVLATLCSGEFWGEPNKLHSAARCRAK